MKQMVNKIHAGNFVHNNGAVLRMLNMLEHRYHKLTSFNVVLKSSGIEDDEFIESVNFLAEDGYIVLRLIETKDSTTLADAHPDLIEAKLSSKGKRLLLGGITDTMIEV